MLFLSSRQPLHRGMRVAPENLFIRVEQLHELFIADGAAPSPAATVSESQERARGEGGGGGEGEGEGEGEGAGAEPTHAPIEPPSFPAFSSSIGIVLKSRFGKDAQPALVIARQGLTTIP